MIDEEIMAILKDEFCPEPLSGPDLVPDSYVEPATIRILKVFQQHLGIQIAKLDKTKLLIEKLEKALEPCVKK